MLNARLHSTVQSVPLTRLKGMRTEEPRFDSQARQQYFLISSPQLTDRLWDTPGFLCNWYRRLFPRGWRRTWSLPLACIKSHETLPPLTHTPPWHGKWSQHRDFTFTFTLRCYSEITHTADYTHGLWLYRLWKGWYCLYRSKSSYIFIWNFFLCLTRSIISALCNRAISLPTTRFDGTSPSSAQHFFETGGSMD